MRATSIGATGRVLVIFLALTMATIAARCQNPAPVPVKPETPRPEEYWRERLSAARQIVMINTRDGALAGIAEDAAAAGAEDATGQALNEMTNLIDKDRAAQSAARKLAKAGHPAAANRIAALITNFNLRDQVMAELAKGDFTLAPDVAAETTTIGIDLPGGRLVLAAAALAFIGLSLLLAVLYLATLHRALHRCAPETRSLRPELVWLLLIPLFNIVWQFIVVSRVSHSLGAEFARRGMKEHAAPGKGVGLAMCVLNCMALVPLSFAFWIAYWVRIARCSNLIRPASPPFISAGGSSVSV